MTDDAPPHGPEMLPAVVPPGEHLPTLLSTYSFKLPEGDSPAEIRERVKVLKGVTERCYMRLAHDLWKCYHRQLYVDFGYDTFDDYVADEVGISRDRAHKLRRIYAILHLKCEIPTREIEEAERGRVELILSVVDRTNARDWLTRAKTLPYRSLQNKLAEVRTRRAESGPEPTSPITPLPQPPIQVAGDSPRAPVVKSAPPSTHKFLKRTFRLPEDGDALLTEALGVAQRITKSHSDTFNLICIVQQFLAHNLTLEGKKDPRKDYWLRWMEEIYGGHFIHIKDETGWDVLRTALEDPANAHLFGLAKRREHDGHDSNDNVANTGDDNPLTVRTDDPTEAPGDAWTEAGAQADGVQPGLGDGDGT
jgi:hypothetical protein